MIGLVAILCSGLFLAGGCAKKELVKSEETAQPMATAQPAPAPSAPAAPSSREGMVKEQPIKEAAVKEDTVKEAQKAESAVSAFGMIHFDFDSFVLTQPSRDILSKNADIMLKKMPAVKVLLEGNCDERGSDEYNLALGEKRAKAALNYLVTLGVKADRLSIISYGKEKPLDPGHDEAAWAKNRRVEFVVVK